MYSEPGLAVNLLPYKSIHFRYALIVGTLSLLPHMVGLVSEIELKLASAQLGRHSQPAERSAYSAV